LDSPDRTLTSREIRARRYSSRRPLPALDAGRQAGGGLSRKLLHEHRGLPSRYRPNHRTDPFERLRFLGDDQDGTALEVMAVELLNDTLYVIHAMETQPRYNRRYREAKQWRT